MARAPQSSRVTIRPFWFANEATCICTGTEGTFAAHTGKQQRRRVILNRVHCAGNSRVILIGWKGDDRCIYCSRRTGLAKGDRRAQVPRHDSNRQLLATKRPTAAHGKRNQCCIDRPSRTAPRITATAVIQYPSVTAADTRLPRLNPE